MAIFETRTNSAFKVDTFEYEGKKYLGISRLYKKKGDSNWNMGKNVALPFDTDKDKQIIGKVIKEMEKLLNA